MSNSILEHVYFASNARRINTASIQHNEAFIDQVQCESVVTAKIFKKMHLLRSSNSGVKLGKD